MIFFDVKKVLYLSTAIVVGVSSAVIFGWVFDIGLLKSILPQFVSMKFTTAISFFLSGFLIFFIYRKFYSMDELSVLLVPMYTLALILIVSIVIIFSFLGITSGLETLFIESDTAAVFTVGAGRPSIGTLAAFIFIIYGGLISIRHRLEEQKRKYSFIGKGILIVSGISTLGYIMDAPFLYYYIPGISTGMALHTTILFIVMGIAFFTISSGGITLKRQI